MERYLIGRQRSKGGPNVSLRTTCYAQVQVWKVRADEFFDKFQDFFARGRRVGALIERVEDKVDCGLF